MSDLRAEQKAERKAERAEHIAGNVVVYLVMAAAGFIVSILLYRGYVPFLQWDGWGHVLTVFGILFGSLLMWIGEHRRPA